jgi:hypothetical protein
MGSPKSTKTRPHSGPAYITLNDPASGNKLTVPANRAARRAYAKVNGHDTVLPPVLRPYVKKTIA